MKKIITTKSGKQIEMLSNLGTEQFYKSFVGSELTSDILELKILKSDSDRLSKDPNQAETVSDLNKKAASLTQKITQSLAFIMSMQAKFFTQDGFVRKTMDALTEENYIEFLCQFEKADFGISMYKEVFQLWSSQTDSTSEPKNTISQLQG